MIEFTPHAPFTAAVNGFLSTLNICMYATLTLHLLSFRIYRSKRDKYAAQIHYFAILYTLCKYMIVHVHAVDFMKI
jgi:hypothetical protein